MSKNEVIFGVDGPFTPAPRVVESEQPILPPAPTYDRPDGLANVVTVQEPEVEPAQAPAPPPIEEIEPILVAAVAEEPLPVKKIKKDRVTRLNPQGRFILFLSLASVFGLMAASFITSFSSITQATDEYTPIPDNVTWLPAFFIDLAIFAYTCSLFWFKYAGQPTRRTIVGMLFFAFLSLSINVAHTVDFWDNDISSYQSWVGIAIVASAPIAVLMASEEISRLAFEDPERLPKKPVPAIIAE